MNLTEPEFFLLKTIILKEDFTIHHIRPMNIGSSVKYEFVLDSLISKGYANIVDSDLVTATDNIKSEIEQTEQIEVKTFIKSRVKRNPRYAILEYLYNRGYALHTEHMPELLKDAVFKSFKDHELFDFIKNEGHYISITDSGKLHFESLKEAATNQEEKDRLDLLHKRFIYKARLWPFIVSGFALLISILSYFKPTVKEQPTTQPAQELKKQETTKTVLPPKTTVLKKALDKTTKSPKDSGAH